MKKLFKVLGTTALVGAAALTVTSCGKKDSTTTENPGTTGGSTTQVWKKPAKKSKIVIGVQQDTDPNTIAMKNILDALKDDLNFTYETMLLNSRDSAANLTKYEEKLTMGFNGIITMADLDKPQAEALIADCEESKAYYAGYKLDMAAALSSTTVKNSKYFLGSTSDGELDWGLRAETLFNALKASTDRKIVLASFSSNYFPQATVALTRFKELVAAHNTANPNDQFTYGKYTNNQDTWTCMFKAMEDADKVALKTQNVDAVISMNSVAKYVLPNLDKSVHLYNPGYEPTYDSEFGADKQLRCQGASPADHIILPLIRIINAVNGADPIPVADKIAVGNYIYMTKAEDLTKLKSSVTNFTTDHAFKDCLFTLDQAKELYKAADSKLTALTNTWTTQYVLSRTAQ